MRALVYGDLQATDGSDKCFNNPTESLQLWRVRKFYAELLRIYTDHHCNALWDLGDAYDDRSSIPVPAIDASLEGVEAFPRGGWNIKLIGNHDQYFRNTKLNSGRMFRPYFRVVGASEVIPGADGASLICCAYEEDSSAQAKWIADAIDRVPAGEKIILIGHFQVVGCQMGSGLSLSGVPQEALSEANLCILGHVHRPQTIGENIHYVGSPFQQDFGESNESKRVGVVDTETCTVEWIPITGFPRYKTLGFNEFVETASAESEDRIKVVLRSCEEAEKFYAHPLATRCEPVYDYRAAEAGQAAPIQLQGRREVLDRYLSRTAPLTRGIPLTPAEMADYGEQLAQAAD